MSLALFALALTVGCKDKKETEADCKDDQEWNAEEEKCEAKSEETAMTKEACEAEGRVWDEEASKCNEAEAEDTVHTIANMLAADLTVASGDLSVALANGECANVKASQFAALKLSGAHECDNGDKAEGGTDNAENDCSEGKAAGNYDVKEVVAADANAVPPVVAKNGLAAAEAAAQNCKELAAAAE